MEVIKRFLEWIRLKEKLHTAYYIPPQITEGELWWASIGENIGQEINGNSRLFSRPVLVFKKLSREMFLAIPMTTKIKQGSWFIKITHEHKEMDAVLSQVRVLDTRRLSTRLGQLDETDFQKVQEGFVKLYLPKIFHSTSEVEWPREIPE